MALPTDGQNANELDEVTEVPEGKELIFFDPTTNAGGIITLENLTKQILNGIASQAFNLDAGQMTILQALNSLNGNSFPAITNVITETPTGAKPLLFRVNGNDIIVNENLTIPRWSIGIYIPYFGDGVIICVSPSAITCAYRSDTAWIISYTLK